MNLIKDELYKHPDIFIARSDVHRWGVFTDSDLDEGSVIEEAPYCEFKDKEVKRSKVLIRYCYGSDNSDTKDCVFGFGFAPLYNHSSEPNVKYELDVVNQCMRHYAIRDIEEGEELLIDYGAGDEWGEDDYCTD